MRSKNRSFAAVAILLGLFIGCKSSRMSQTETNINVVHRFNEALNTFNYDLFDELMKPDFVRHCQASGDPQIRSREEYKLYYQEFVKAFPDAHTTNHFLFAEGDKVAAYATLTGTQKGPFGSLPASEKKIKSDFIGILRMEEGKIAEIWVEWDNLAILTQLGYYPPPAKGEE
jgi:steroid delta-isomerase-like uncharacterized protein